MQRPAAPTSSTIAPMKIFDIAPCTRIHQSPLEIVSARRSETSMRSPSTIASSSGAGSNFALRST